MVRGVTIKDHWSEQRIFDQRSIAAGVIIVTLTVILIGRLFLLQVIRFDYYTELSQGNRVRIEPIPAARGLILDRNGEVIASNQPAYQLELVPEQVTDLKTTLNGHTVYGVSIKAGMGYRAGCTGCGTATPKGMANGDQPETEYMVTSQNGKPSGASEGCCFEYGNAETDSRDDGNGTMETTYYGNATAWYHGNTPGPWIMTDQENNLVGCVTSDGSKLCRDLPNITWRFVTAIAKGEPHHWTSMGGDAQRGRLSVMFDGPRVDHTYDPMRKQGAILLGNGGDNSVGSQGTFYEGASSIRRTSFCPTLSPASIDLSS